MEDEGITVCGYHPQWISGGDPCWRDAHRDHARGVDTDGHRLRSPAPLVVRRAWDTLFANGWLQIAFAGQEPDTGNQCKACGCNREGRGWYYRKIQALFPVRCASVQTLN